MKKLSDSNIVIVASNLDLTFYNLFWFVEQGIVAKDEILFQSSVFSPQAIVLDTSKMMLQIVPDHFICTIKDLTFAVSFILPCLVNFFNKIPPILYRAIGINFIWDITGDEGKDIWNSSFILFGLQKKSPLKAIFNTRDSLFGYYASKNSNGFRLKLDIKPIRQPSEQNQASEPTHAIRCSFNYHHDFSSKESPSDIITSLINDKWNLLHDESTQITTDLEGGTK